MITYSILLLLCRIVVSLACGGTFTANSGEITSPNYPSDYPSSSSCTYNIAPSAGYLVQLYFDDYETENGYDFVKVYDSSDVEVSSLTGDRTGTAITPSTSYRVVLTSDPWTPKRGFKATWACGGRFTSDTGEIISPLYPSSYPSSISCTYTVTSSAGFLVQLYFDDFETEGGYDIVKVYDSSDVEVSSLTGTRTGTAITPSTSYRVVLTTDPWTPKRGFKATWSCGGIFTASTGSIKSPLYPANYPDSTACTYTITPPEGELLRLVFNDFETADNNDVVTVFDSNDDEVASLHGALGRAVVVSSTGFRVVMGTDAAIGARGFSATWAAAPSTTVNLEIGLDVMTCPVSTGLTLASPVGSKVKVLQKVTLTTESDCQTACFLLTACIHCKYETGSICVLYEFEASASLNLIDVYVKS